MTTEDLWKMLKNMCSELDGYAKQATRYFDNVYESWKAATDAARVGKGEASVSDTREVRKGLRGLLRGLGSDVDLKDVEEEERNVYKMFDKISRDFKRNGAFFENDMFKKWVRYAEDMIKSDPSSSTSSVWSILPGINTSAFKISVDNIKKSASKLEKNLDNIRDQIRRSVRVAKDPADKNRIIKGCLEEAKSYINVFFGEARKFMDDYVIHINESLKTLGSKKPGFYNLYKILKCYFFLKSTCSTGKSGTTVVRFGDEIESGDKPGWFEKWLNEEFKSLENEAERTTKIDSKLVVKESHGAAAAATASDSSLDESDAESEEDD